MTAKTRLCPQGHDKARFGVDLSNHCLECRRVVREAKAAREAEAAETYWAAVEFHREELARKQEEKYHAALKAGGATRANALWDRANDEMLDKGRYGLCQYEDEGPTGEFDVGRLCYRPAADVYCGPHGRLVDREAAQRGGTVDHGTVRNQDWSHPRSRKNPATKGGPHD